MHNLLKTLPLFFTLQLLGCSVQSNLSNTNSQNQASFYHPSFYNNKVITAADSKSESINKKSKQPTNINAIKEKISRNFIAPDNVAGLKTMVLVELNKKGEVIKVTTTGRSLMLNQAAKLAVVQSSPLDINPNDSRFYPNFLFEIVAE